jgi:hypothetical protein
MSTAHATLKLLRKLHLYVGVFIAPALLFFAFTGAMQSFSLHETTQGSSYKPPAWLVALGQLHKKQTTDVPVRKQRPVAPDQPSADAKKVDKAAPLPLANTAPSGAKPEPSTPRPKTHLPMKIFFVLVSAGLLVSTLTGIYMVYKYSRRKVLISGLLLAGIIVPILILPF